MVNPIHLSFVVVVVVEMMMKYSFVLVVNVVVVFEDDYDYLIFGISTWDYGELQEDWESHWEEVAELDLRNKVVALYGMGDQIGYLYSDNA